MKINPSRSPGLLARTAMRAALCFGLSVGFGLDVGIGAASANPSGATVIAGQVTFSRQGNVFTITNSPNAIINWDSFSISLDEMTRFIQQSSSSSVLNRITGQSPSLILGALQSNGRVLLINPNGIIFGAGAQVNVANLVASTLGISNADFLAGKNHFAATGNVGNVVNQGAITTPSGGQVLLIAPNVINTGIITSPEGEVLLAAGHKVQLADSSNPSLHVVVSSPSDQAINLGQVIAQGGKIGIYGALVNQRGALNANSAAVGDGGKIVLRASRTTLLEAGSVTTATGGGKGGEIHVLGDQVGLIGNAKVDASGQTGGGTVLIGGDYQGANAAIANARQVFVDRDAIIAADAITRGRGGKVIVWGDQTARVHGTISARGGAESGDGGFVETSGHFLDVNGVRVKTGAAHGKTGTWLLDPYDISVSDSNMPSSLGEVQDFAFDLDPMNPNQPSQLTASQLSNTDGNIMLQARHNIDFDSPINIHANFGLTALAGNDINVNASIVTNGGALVLSANDNGGGTASGTGRVNLNGGSTLTANGNTVTIRQSTPVPTPPPSPDICTIAPNSPLCQVLSPPTASEPNKPVAQALNETVNIINTTTKAIPAADSKPSDKKEDAKKDAKAEKAPSDEKTKAANEPLPPKTFCN